MASIVAADVQHILEVHRLPFDSLHDYRRVWEAAPGSHEEGLGRLIIITPDIVAQAAKDCIRSGRRTTLGWSMDQLNIANFNRAPIQHHIVPLLNGSAFDDIYTFNPQQSSQWDGLRHFSAPWPASDEPDRRLFVSLPSGCQKLLLTSCHQYGGVTSEEIIDRSSTRIGIHHWADEGICGRGVLLDYASYAKRHGIKYSSFSDHSIPLSVLLEVAREQNDLQFRRGDILLIRIGLIQEWENTMTAEEKQAYAESSTPKHAGVEGTDEMLRWIWNSGFAAVAGDSMSFEVYPPQESYARGEAQGVKGVFMQEVLLAGWGMPVGELLDLDKLSALCESEGRWDFFLSSAPFKMPGGVSSPPNCMAFF